MIKTKTVYYAQCDSCSDKLQYPDDCERADELMFTEKDLLALMDEVNWFEHEGKIICEDCILKFAEPTLGH
ncbi:MAG: hypothetical protein DDT23_01189 [candidate division WS2 bacterium]|nr:hypothetical protein [Candidatus Lithacetigena glycinireducens]